MKLSFAHERFAVEYVRTRSATVAYALAFPDAELSTAQNRGSQLLKDPLVKQKVESYQQLLRESFGIDAQSVIDEMKKIAFSEVTDVVEIVDTLVQTTDNEGNATETLQQARLREAEAIPPDARGAISEISTGRDGSFKVKMHNKMEALKSLGAHLGLFEEKVSVEVKHTHDLSEVAKAALSRVRQMKAVEASHRVEGA